MLVVHFDRVVQHKQDQQQSSSTTFARPSSLLIVGFTLFINMQEELHMTGKKRKLNSIASKYLYCPTKHVLDQSRLSLSRLRSPCCSFQCRISG